MRDIDEWHEDVTIEHVREHLHPVWAHLADSAVYAYADDEGRPENFYEKIPTKDLGDNRHQICAVTLFAHNLALGDIVSVRLDQSGRLIFEDVVERSGRFDYRIWLGDVPAEDKDLMRRHIVNPLSGLGCVLEHYSENLIGINAPDEDVAQKVVDLLVDLEPDGIDWEAANT